MDCTYHLHKSCPSTLAPLHHTNFSFFKHLPSPSRSYEMPLLVLLVLYTLRFHLAMSELISYCYKNCLDRCEEKWVWKSWGKWTSRRSQLFTWTSCGGITVTVQTFIVTINRHHNICPHISHTKYRPLAEQSYTNPWLQLKENRESIWMSGPIVEVLWF